MMRIVLTAVISLAIALVISGCATLADSQAPQKAEPATNGVRHPVTIESVALLKPEATVTLTTTFMVYNVETGYHRARDYYVLIAPNQGVATKGRVTFVTQLDDSNTPYEAPAWQVEQGFARLFGWFPISTDDHIVAGGIGTSFILQRVGGESRVFLVNVEQGGNDKVEVRPRDQPGATAVVLDEGNFDQKYIRAMPDNAGGVEIKLEDFPADADHPINKFVARIEKLASDNGLP